MKRYTFTRQETTMVFTCALVGMMTMGIPIFWFPPRILQSGWLKIMKGVNHEPHH